VDRFPRLALLSQHWDGLISAAIFIRNDGELSALQEFQRSKIYAHTKQNVDFHLLFANENQDYPINVLRNLALDHVRPESDYVLCLDVDFIPSEGAYAYIRDFLKSVQNGTFQVPDKEEIAFVVASFEIDGLTPDTVDELLPPNKRALLPLIKNQMARQVHVKFAPEAQGPTNYTHWEETNTPYEVRYQGHYEPYYFVSTHHNLLRYDARFKGYGFDKASHTYEMQRKSPLPPPPPAAATAFVVIPEVFVTHVDHEEQAWKAQQPHIMTRVWMNMYAFMVEIEKSIFMLKNNNNNSASDETISETVAAMAHEKKVEFQFADLQDFDFLDWAAQEEHPIFQPKSMRLKKIGFVCAGVAIVMLAFQVFFKDEVSKAHDV